MMEKMEKKDMICLIVSGIGLLLSMLHVTPLPFDLAWVAIVLCGVPIVSGAAVSLVKEFDIKADVLVSIALVASVCIGEIFAAGEVAFIMQLGAMLEELTVANARAGIEKLVSLTPRTARVLRENYEEIIPAEEVKKGDRLRILPGETIPVDGVILQGASSIDQAVMTGESLPVDKSEGDEVSSGTVNQYGTFEMEAVKVGEDSSIQRMIRLVQSADAGKAKITRMADQWATWIVVTALAAALLTWFITGEIIRSVTILVVFCPCALVLATPTAIMAAIGNAAKHGFLIRMGDAMERLAKATKITFDKTGTLTYGTLSVTAVRSFSEHTEEELLIYAASAEQFSEHPLGKAVMKEYKEKIGKPIPEVKNFNMIPGKGIHVITEGKEITVGSEKLAEDINILPEIKEQIEEYRNKGATVIYILADRKLIGYMALSDTVRKESRNMICAIKKQKVQPVLLTGDNQKAAYAIGTSLELQEIYGECLPEDKLNHIAALQAQGESVCMIGDGINDAPALKKADIGIAMGGIGSDIAVDAADIVLINDEVKELPHLVALSQHMMKTIKLNLTFSMALNFLAITLAITGLLGPVAGALVHNAGSVLVIVNSAFLLKWKMKSEA